MLVLPFLALALPVRAGKTGCVSGQLDWYTSLVGETPCRTFERVRQVCNPTYEVPLIPEGVGSHPTSDHCTDSVFDCCCNAVTFALRTLCMNCQRCTDDKGPDCIDPAQGDYDHYRIYDLGSNDKDPQHCKPVNANGFSYNTQAALCKSGIRIPDTLYAISSYGNNSYAYLRDSVMTNFASNGESEFSKCSEVLVLGSTQPGSPQTPAPSGPSPESLHVLFPIYPPPRSVLSTYLIVPSPTSTRPRSTSPSGSPASQPTSSPSPSTSSTPKQAIPIALIVGALIGGMAGLLMVVGMIAWLVSRIRKRSGQRVQNEGQHLWPALLGPPNITVPTPSHSGVLNEAGTSASVSANRQPTLGRAYPPLSGPSDGRHIDGGPVTVNPLARSGSGRLPPLYGTWNNSS